MSRDNHSTRWTVILMRIHYASWLDGKAIFPAQAIELRKTVHGSTASVQRKLPYTESFQTIMRNDTAFAEVYATCSVFVRLINILNSIVYSNLSIVRSSVASLHYAIVEKAYSSMESYLFCSPALLETRQLYIINISGIWMTLFFTFRRG